MTITLERLLTQRKESGEVARYQYWPKSHKLLKADEVKESPDKHKEYIDDESTTPTTVRDKVVNYKLKDTAERVKSNSTKLLQNQRGVEQVR